jgi:peptidoglycan/LPS O-acetylase OafA/YrhL
MLLLVPVHAAILLSINGHGGGWAQAIYWLVHVFRLPLFFAMSGFFLVLLLSRKGLRETARNRTIRIVAPLAIGLVTLVPLLVLASQMTDTVITGDGEIAAGSPFAFEPSFLWFLWYLLIIDTLAISLYLLAPGMLSAAGARLRAYSFKPLLVIPLLALPTALALWGEAAWSVEPATDTFVPEIPALAYYALFFTLGATLSAHRDIVERAGENAWRWAACGAAATIPAALLFALHNSATGTRTEVHAAALLTLAIATWTSLIALIGLAARYLTSPRPALRYMADSSYWIYLSHLPAMVLLIALIGTTSLGTAPQFVLVTAGALAFSLLTYAAFVRYTAIGTLLNGPRTRPRHQRQQQDPGLATR